MPGKDKKETSSATTATKAYPPAFSLISTQKLLQLYSIMINCRLIEERLQSPSRRVKSAAVDGALSGQEAVIVGAAVDLRPEDAIASLQDQLMVRFVKGTPIDELLRRTSLRSTRSGKAGPTPAAQLKSAVKAAQAGKKNPSGNIAVVFSRDCATASNSWRNALTIAKRKMLPMIFVCHSGLPHRPGSNRPRTATKVNSPQPPRGLPVFKVDGSDVVAVYRVAHEAIARARKNRGPSLIECAPWCVARTLVSRPSSLHGAKAVAGAEAIDPILKMETYLAAKGLFTAGMRRRIERGFRKELIAALPSAKPASLRKSKPAAEIRPLKIP
ncbi:MAG: thiamine pyrophosphate-dependent enzyme [Terracidiphilus sp.]